MSHRIRRLALNGDGVADGPVRVARSLPGELVDGPVEDGRIDRPRILEPVPERVTPPCPHYRACGGCALMHASDTFVERWKADIVRAALAARGLMAEISVVVTSPAHSRRRAVLSGRRLKGGPVVGFHGRASETVTTIPGCRLVVPEILTARPAMAEITALLGSRKGEMRLAVTASSTGIDIDFSGGRPLDYLDRAALAAIADRHDLARLSCAGETVVERRPPVVDMDGIGVVPPPGAFLQATAEGEAALRAHVMAATAGASRIADLFAGCGTFALPLARAAEVVALEGDPAMTSALDRGWRAAAGLKRITATTRDLFRRPLEPDELSRFDAVVIDPPRAGAEAQMRAIAASPVPVVAHVSCNPVTFARDAATLADAGYRMGPVTVVDQFRWSAHVELAATFIRNHMPATERRTT